MTNLSVSLPVPTWATQKNALQLAGVASGRALERIRTATAPLRHAARVAATAEALARAYTDPTMQWVALTLDLHGMGGPRDAGGAGCRTTRMPWAAGLGAGRWQARDGDAWRAAAVEMLAGMVHIHAGTALADHDLEIENIELFLAATPAVAPWVRSWSNHRIDAGAASAPANADELNALGGLLDLCEAAQAAERAEALAAERAALEQAEARKAEAQAAEAARAERVVAEALETLLSEARAGRL